MASPISDPLAQREREASFAALAATLTHVVAIAHPPHKVTSATPAERDAHPKHHGCVDATFTVADDIPECLCHGVFKPGASYCAAIRFSNAFKVRHDLDKDARGMAIKLLNVKGEPVKLPTLNGQVAEMMDQGVQTQDFLLVTHPEFFSKTAAEFVDIIGAIVSTSNITLVGIRVFRRFFGIKPPRFKWSNFVAFVRTFTVTPNPVFLEYLSQTPYLLDDAAAGRGESGQSAKFCARPLKRASWWPRVKFNGILWAYRFRSLFAFVLGPVSWKKDFLRSALARYLTTEDAEFEFCIQRRTDPATMPLDDATRKWSTKQSRYERVATIRIHKNPLYQLRLHHAAPSNRRASDFLPVACARGPSTAWQPERGASFYLRPRLEIPSRSQ